MKKGDKGGRANNSWGAPTWPPQAVRRLRFLFFLKCALVALFGQGLPRLKQGLEGLGFAVQMRLSPGPLK
jgi:hypothetical protein